MVAIKLEKPWTYRTPEVTIDYTAGEHEVFQCIADKAETEGVIAKEEEDAKEPAPRTTRKAKG
ncbi:hypothetical protein [Allopontixanthobacter sediminis]|uniref:Uncharacterized protein n=1 Tax=Allopontixanthobacter sediminis TaxID=1689985 RepID=A0A845AXK6_9SPHN|nr:hypothetical protein [Allopontixanthobacter sediminis]MXP42985.1 hypothetical protein [Allopontixanthobacter sediminis]